MTNKEEAKRAYKEAKAAWQNDMNEIRAMHGSERIRGSAPKQLTT